VVRDFEVWLDVLRSLRDEVRYYDGEQREAIRHVLAETERAHVFLENAERTWSLRNERARDEFERCEYESMAAAAMGGWIDCSGWADEVDWTGARLDETRYWHGELNAAEGEFRPYLDRLARRIERDLPRAHRFLVGLVVAVEKALSLRIGRG
jgi:hypothetical protein